MDALTTRPHIAVFCASKFGNDDVYRESARTLAEQIHKVNGVLVYGGGSEGLMGEVSKTLIELSGPDAVFGVIPKHLVNKERPHDEATYGRAIIVDDMHQRMVLMVAKVIECSVKGSGFVVLPGSWGTWAELAQVVTDAGHGRIDKPIVALSIKGFYDGLETQIRRGVEEGFMTKEVAAKSAVVETVEEAMARLLQG